jgi:hypothetical protein
MLRPDFAKWDQNAEEMLRLSIEAEHARTRERCLALYMIGSGQTNATQWSQTIGRQNVTVQGWIHHYNEQGMAGIIYVHTGGPAPLFAQQSVSK